MPIDLSVSVDLPRLQATTDATIRAALLAQTHAVREQTRALEKDFEHATRAAVPGRLHRAWQSDAFPSRGGAREPVGRVWVAGKKRSQGAMQYFTQPGRVTSRSGGWLAIFNAKTPRWRDMTPGMWEQQNGQKLEFVFINNRLAALVTRNRRFGPRQRTYRNIVIFWLIPFTAHQPRVGLTAIATRRAAILYADILHRVPEYIASMRAATAR